MCCTAVLEGSHSDKLLTPDVDTTPLRTITFPAATCPTVQETLTSIMQVCCTAHMYVPATLWSWQNTILPT